MKTKHVTPVLKVASLDTALAHYKDVLGFAEEFRIGNYAGVKLGSISVHLAEQAEHDVGEYAKPVGASTIYIFCDEIDGYYSEVKSKGARVKYEPKNWPYGMRDFRVVDPDGNHLSFGCELDENS